MHPPNTPTDVATRSGRLPPPRTVRKRRQATSPKRPEARTVPSPAPKKARAANTPPPQPIPCPQRPPHPQPPTPRRSHRL